MDRHKEYHYKWKNLLRTKARQKAVSVRRTRDFHEAKQRGAVKEIDYQKDRLDMEEAQKKGVTKDHSYNLRPCTVMDHTYSHAANSRRKIPRYVCHGTPNNHLPFRRCNFFYQGDRDTDVQLYTHFSDC